MDFGPLVPASNSAVREVQPAQSVEMIPSAPPRLYPDRPSHESSLGESLRILRKRKWIVLASLVSIFSVVAIASLKMSKIYEANGTIEINKPDASLNFQNSATFSLDYFDPTELETDMKILHERSARPASNPRVESLTGGRSWLIRLRPRCLRRSISHPTRCRTILAWLSAAINEFKGSLRVNLSPNTRIIEVHYRSRDPQLAATVVNTLMQTYVENNFKARFDSTMQASDWLQKQLVDLQMKVETSQEKLVQYQREHGNPGNRREAEHHDGQVGRTQQATHFSRQRAHGQGGLEPAG